LSGSLSDWIAFRTVSQCPLLMSDTNPSTLSTVFNETPVSSYDEHKKLQTIINFKENELPAYPYELLKVN
jgi:hypothetical protein